MMTTYFQTVSIHQHSHLDIQGIYLHYLLPLCAGVCVSFSAPGFRTIRQRHRCYVTSYHQNNRLGNSSELISMRLGPGDNMMMVAEAASTREHHLPFLYKLRMRRCIYNLSLSHCLSLSSFSSLLLTSILSPLCEYGHHMIPL